MWNPRIYWWLPIKVYSIAPWKSSEQRGKEEDSDEEDEEQEETSNNKVDNCDYLEGDLLTKHSPASSSLATGRVDLGSMTFCFCHACLISIRSCTDQRDMNDKIVNWETRSLPHVPSQHRFDRHGLNAPQRDEFRRYINLGTECSCFMAQGTEWWQTGRHSSWFWLRNESGCWSHKVIKQNQNHEAFLCCSSPLVYCRRHWKSSFRLWSSFGIERWIGKHGYVYIECVAYILKPHCQKFQRSFPLRKKLLLHRPSPWRPVWSLARIWMNWTFALHPDPTDKVTRTVVVVLPEGWTLIVPSTKYAVCVPGSSCSKDQDCCENECYKCPTPHATCFPKPVLDGNPVIKYTCNGSKGVSTCCGTERQPCQEHSDCCSSTHPFATPSVTHAPPIRNATSFSIQDQLRETCGYRVEAIVYRSHIRFSVISESTVSRRCKCSDWRFWPSIQVQGAGEACHKVSSVRSVIKPTLICAKLLLSNHIVQMYIMGTVRSFLLERDRLVVATCPRDCVGRTCLMVASLFHSLFSSRLATRSRTLVSNSSNCPLMAASSAALVAPASW